MIFRSRSLLECSIIFFTAVVIYLALPTKNYYWDGLIYGDYIEKVVGFGPHLFHPNHLLYNFLGFVVHRALRLISPEFRALFALQAITIFFGACCAAVFYAILRKLFDLRQAIVTTALLAFSAGWWRFATDADVYIISIFFLLVSFLASFALDRSRPFVAAISFAIAALFHQLAIFFLPVMILALLTTKGARNRGLAAAALSLTIIAVAYTGAFLFIADAITIEGFLNWLTARAEAANRSFTVGDAIYWLVAGTRRLFVDGSIRLVGRDVASIVSVCIFGVLSVGLIVSSVIGLARSTPDRRSSEPSSTTSSRFLVRLCLVWIAPYVAFLLIFMPENTFYRLFYFPPLILLVGLFLGKIRVLNNRRETLPLLVAAFAMYNFTFYIYPNSYVREGSALAAAYSANKVWTTKTWVIYDPAEQLDGPNRLVAYFNPGITWTSFDMLTDAEKDSVVRGTPTSGDVWIASSVLERYAPDEIGIAEPAPEDVIVGPKANIRFIKIRPR